ncbi:glycosyltransferase family 1 protein [Patescibacteria group bacterium]|nr:MAG: glycosyltransferase family 1 protein [Patescibacteria group bacterium]
MQKPRILFLSHTYPPIVGGVETQNYELFTWLSKIADVRLIANRQRYLVPFFLIYSVFPVLFLVGKYDVLLLGSSIEGNIGWLIKKLTRKSVVAVAHGLDLTWKNKLYQLLWPKVFIPSLDKLIAVGNETIRVGMERGIPESKFVFVPNGVDTERNLGNYSRADLEKIVGESIENKKIVLTSGRLAKRKGVAWFIQNVLPKLPANVLYVVSGEGVDRENIQKAIESTASQAQVKMLGYTTDKVRNTLFNTADVFVQPNIKVDGDMEGFGISVIEATACRLPVVASNLEGLRDAIKDNQNGFLVEPGDANGFAKKITELLDNDDLRREFGEKARQYAIDNYSWDKIAMRYLEELKKITSNQ